MKSVDLHPEDLIERERRDELSAADRERLDAHLRECAVCRFERTVAEDFRREAEALDPTIDVQQMLGAVLAPGLPPHKAVVSAGRPRRGWLRAGAATAVLLVVGGVSAATLRFSLARSGAHGHREGADGHVDTSPPPTTLSRRPYGASTAPTATEAVIAAESAAPPAVLDPPAIATSTGLPPGPSVVAAPNAPPHPASSATPASLFARANEARHAGDVQRAVMAYQELLAEFPDTPEALTSEALLGKVLLDSNRPGEALGHFDSYLRARGPLREDVMLDRALALRSIGRRQDEAQAWAALLAEFPGSVHGERARRRLAELNGP